MFFRDLFVNVPSSHHNFIPTDAQPPAPLPIVLDVQPTPTLVSPWVRHKTTRRDVYDSARERTGCDYGGGGLGKEGLPFDVVLWNERREVTETSIANLAVEVKAEGEEGSVWKTPPVECGELFFFFFFDRLLGGLVRLLTYIKLNRPPGGYRSGRAVRDRQTRGGRYHR